MDQFPHIQRALQGALRFTATVAAVIAVLAFVNRLAGIAFPGDFG